MRNPLRRAFTLIELLVVIAIIALLTAILFPVFATVRENARQSASLSNLHAISSALGQFQLDNHQNPDVLFGYVYKQYVAGSAGDGFTGPVIAMDKAYAQAQSDAQSGADISGKFSGLYPEYIHDLASFRDPNNPDNGNNTAVASTKINVLCPSTLVTCTPGPQPTGDDGVLKPKTDVQFYKVDAYDVSPQVTGANKLGTTYVPRYQSSWTDVDNKFNPSTGCGGTAPATCTNNTNYYTHQMRWKNPPADTYVTSTTYHVPNAGTVLVLWEDGSVRKQNVQQFTQYGADASDISVNTVTGVTAANFWKLTPAQ